MFRLKKQIEKTVSSILLLTLVLFFILPTLSTRALGHASDVLSLTWPSTPASHSITFRLTKDLPAGGQIIITPQPTKFFLMAGFDYRDVDLATSTALNAVFHDRALASSSGATYDGVNTLASSTSGVITINLNSTQDILANTYVNIELGTNATYGTSSSRQIINPATIGSYRIEVKTFSASGVYLERAVMMVGIIQPVTMGSHIIKARSNGTPAGVLNYGTTQTIMSLNTNYQATCRWSTIASTSYATMTNTFSNTGNYYHSDIIIGLGNGGDYYYYIRCLDGNGVADDTDFVINFSIAGFDGEDGDEDTEGTPGGGGGAGPGSGGGSGGGGGSGSGTGFGDYSPFPELPTQPVVAFKGWAYPGAKVNLLKDGVEEQTITAAANGLFSIDIMEIDQGVYTFNLWASDNAGRKSATQAYTFYVKDGTKTELYDIYLPPTIDVIKPSLEIGDILEIQGQSAAKSNIDLWLYPKVVGGVIDGAILKYQGISEANGNWQFALQTDTLLNGLYQLKARSKLDTAGPSEFSIIKNIMIGGELPAETCAGADLNADGKVNITDFSILLYWWTTDNECADQNNDGTVNLIDFSIMMYHWTG